MLIRTSEGDSAMPNPGAEESVEPMPDPKWTREESWIWEQIRTGSVADLSKLDAESHEPAGEGINQENLGIPLKASFLRQILSDEKFRKSLPPEGVWIANARFDDFVNLDHIRVERPLRLERSHFNAG